MIVRKNHTIFDLRFIMLKTFAILQLSLPFFGKNFPKLENPSRYVKDFKNPILFLISPVMSR